jgi:hypothetical protein|tara:strand:- start:3815 stop:4024 length:210 start_codon:yes stop_codon:yes gene_type:complete
VATAAATRSNGNNSEITAPVLIAAYQTIPPYLYAAAEMAQTVEIMAIELLRKNKRYSLNAILCAMLIPY